MSFLIVPLALSGCGDFFRSVTADNFCDIAEPDVYASEDVARFMVQNDPDHVRNDLAENAYGKENCGWDV